METHALCYLVSHLDDTSDICPAIQMTHVARNAHILVHQQIRIANHIFIIGVGALRQADNAHTYNHERCNTSCSVSASARSTCQSSPSIDASLSLSHFVTWSSAPFISHILILICVSYCIVDKAAVPSQASPPSCQRVFSTQCYG